MLKDLQNEGLFVYYLAYALMKKRIITIERNNEHAKRFRSYISHFWIDYFY
jgi:predicted O-methyltransferase YrrM